MDEGSDHATQPYPGPRGRAASSDVRSDQSACRQARYRGGVKEFYRTAAGKTLRMEETDDGMLSVKVLKDGVWTDAPRGMFGLRLSPTTRRLTAREIGHLPA